jgi:uncharacterized protein (TIGR03663 family)
MILPFIPLILILLLRFIALDARPIHHDEAVNGWFVDGVFSKGFYSYDPQNYHGPLYFYLLALSEKIFGRNLIALRIPSVVLGSLIALSPLRFKRIIGAPAAWIAAFFLALSPALVFYSRYAIHETGFAFLCIMFLHQWLTIRDSGWTPKRMLLLSLTVGFMASMKENFVLFGAALGISEFAVSVIEGKSSLPLKRNFWLNGVLCLGLAFIPIALLFTGFFQDPDGVSKFFEAFLRWFDTGSNGNGHQKPFWYWLKVMGTYEWVSLLGLALLPFFLTRVERGARLIGVLGGVLWFIYSLVSYKTPWCILSFYVFLVFFGSIAVARALYSRYRASVILGLVMLTGVSIWQNYDVAWNKPDQDGHPYVYGQTYSTLLPPVNRILSKVNASPELKESLRIQVVSEFTWPLPYLLGEIKSVGYFSKDTAPARLDADVIIMDESLLPMFQQRVSGMYEKEAVPSRQWASRAVFLFKQGEFQSPGQSDHP